MKELEGILNFHVQLVIEYSRKVQLKDTSLSVQNWLKIRSMLLKGINPTFESTEKQRQLCFQASPKHITKAVFPQWESLKWHHLGVEEQEHQTNNILENQDFPQLTNSPKKFNFLCVLAAVWRSMKRRRTKLITHNDKLILPFNSASIYCLAICLLVFLIVSISSFSEV